MRTLSIAAGLVAAAALTGCGDRTAPDAALGQAPRAERPEVSAPEVLVFRRIRYEGATTRKLTLRRDGTFDVDIPNGGAGGSAFSGRLTSTAFRAIRKDIVRTPWGHLTPRNATYDESGAYFIVRHGRHEHVAMSAGMSRDIMPLVDRLNGVLNGEGRAEYRVRHRYYTP